jgi:prepilin-type N-terminal cleavage/methylation domain-containing protein
MKTLRNLRRDDSGFTLIEVLTVSAIIGILSSIAIPVLSSQTQKAQSATGATDLRNTATAMEAYFADHGVYPSASDLAADGSTPGVSNHTTVVIVTHSGTTYCLAALRSKPVPATFAELQTDATRWYDSAAGGVQTAGTTSCPTTTAVAADWQTDTFSH